MYLTKDFFEMRKRIRGTHKYISDVHFISFSLDLYLKVISSNKFHFVNYTN